MNNHSLHQSGRVTTGAGSSRGTALSRAAHGWRGLRRGTACVRRAANVLRRVGRGLSSISGRCSQSEARSMSGRVYGDILRHLQRAEHLVVDLEIHRRELHARSSVVDALGQQRCAEYDAMFIEALTVGGFDSITADSTSGDRRS